MGSACSKNEEKFPQPKACVIFANGSYSFIIPPPPLNSYGFHPGMSWRIKHASRYFAAGVWKPSSRGPRSSWVFCPHRQVAAQVKELPTSSSENLEKLQPSMPGFRHPCCHKMSLLKVLLRERTDDIFKNLILRPSYQNHTKHHSHYQCCN